MVRKRGRWGLPRLVKGLRVHKYFTDLIGSGHKIHLTLIDPDKPCDVERASKMMVEAGTDGFLIGGSLGVTPEDASSIAKILKEHGLPVIIFPGNLNCLTPEADAILFMILMNSLDPYYIIGAQVAGAPLVKKYGLEPLPTGYVVVYGGSAVAHVGRIVPIPEKKPEIIAAYALAAEMLGLKYFYIEAGSGAPKPVPPSFPRAAKTATQDLIIIVGGGIRDPDTARELALAGADIIVTGTIVEEDPEKAKKIIRAIKTISSR